MTVIYKISTKKNTYYSIVLSLCMTVFTYLFADVSFIAFIGLSLFFTVFFSLIIDTGSALPIRRILLFMAILEWIVGPVLAYNGFYVHYKYYMYVPEADYMALAIPGVFGLAFGLGLFYDKNEVGKVNQLLNRIKAILKAHKYLPIYFIALGFIFSNISPFAPSGLGFIFYLLSNLKYVGLMLLIKSDRPQKLSWVISLMLLFFIEASARGLFHDFILWSVFISFILFHEYNIGIKNKIILFLSTVFVIASLQSVKHEYRDLVWQQGEEASFLTYAGLVVDRLFNGPKSGSQGDTLLESAAIRINQGWVISRIMTNVPNNIPYANGDTIITAVKAAVLPRLLFPDKPTAGGKENYQKYTKYELRKTSIGISLLGEAYINFGKYGGALALFVYGLCISFALSLALNLSVNNPIFLVFIPLVFFHVVKAETELLVVLNFIVKAFIVSYSFSYLFRRFNKNKRVYV